jgi:hypothetical protein
MRELKVVGLDLDGRRIICETADTGEKFLLRPDERLRAAARGDRTVATPVHADTHAPREVPNVLRPRDIQARIRAGASVEQVASAAGVDIERVERFAHPVLLERSRAAELATAAHPVLADGPAVLTLLETVTTALVARGLDPESTAWDAWRNEDGRWTVQLGWKAGLSDNTAHFRFTPGSHGGTVTAFDDAAAELIDPDFTRTLRPLATVPALVEPASDDPGDTGDASRVETALELDIAVPDTRAAAPATGSAGAPAADAPAKPARQRKAKARPTVPAWEDVLLGVRSSGGER